MSTNVELTAEHETGVQGYSAELRSCNGNYQLVHERLREKRLAWWEANKDRIDRSGSLPRQAYKMVLLDYMGINPEEVPIIHEDETTITWASYNFCPLLEACTRLKLDTRVVCKEGMEQSVQDFILMLDPRLRFSRDYKNLRPYGPACVETIWLSENEPGAR